MVKDVGLQWMQSKSKAQRCACTQPKNLRMSVSSSAQHADEKMQVGLHRISACKMMWNDMMPEQAAIHRKMSKHFQMNCRSAATTRSRIIIDNGMKRHVRGWFKGGGNDAGNK